MGQTRKDSIESEFIGVLVSALKKGMTAEEFFAVADTTLEHLRGAQTNETIEKIINETASPDEVAQLFASLKKEP